MAEQKEHVAVEKQPESGLAIAALVLGVVSMTGPGLLLGIPAIIMGSIALKRKLAGRGLALAGLITGIISTVLSLLFIAFIIVMIIWSNLRPQDFTDPQYHHWDSQSQQDPQPYSSSRT